MTWYRHSSGQVTECHISAYDVPVIVIDAEDAEQVARLATAYDTVLERHFPDEHSTWQEIEQGEDNELMQAALREFATPPPPRPDEPRGRYAVVEDAEGKEWIHKGDLWFYSAPKALVMGHSHWIKRAWADVQAVRVLSEGVS